MKLEDAYLFKLKPEYYENYKSSTRKKVFVATSYKGKTVNCKAIGTKNYRQFSILELDLLTDKEANKIKKKHINLLGGDIKPNKK